MVLTNSRAVGSVVKPFSKAKFQDPVTGDFPRDQVDVAGSLSIWGKAGLKTKVKGG